MRWTRVLASLAALLLPGSTLLAQAEAPGRITGTVTQDAAGGPISDVTVSIPGTRMGALTGPDATSLAVRSGPSAPPRASCRVRTRTTRGADGCSHRGPRHHR